MWLTAGEFTEKFEKAISAKTGIRHTLFVNSGSSANLLAITALKEFYNLQDGDEVITSAVNFPTTLNPIIQNTNSLQNEIGALKNMQSNSVNYTKQFELLNKNFQLLSNRTSQNKESQSTNLKELSDSLHNFYSDINIDLAKSSTKLFLELTPIIIGKRITIICIFFFNEKNFNIFSQIYLLKP